MAPTKFLKHLLLTLPFLTSMQLVQAQRSPPPLGTQPPLNLNATAASVSHPGTCPYNQICTGDIVLIGFGKDDFARWEWTLISTRIEVAKDAYDLGKGYLPVQSGGPNFHGFYYQVKPGKTYYFRATYRYYKCQTKARISL